MLLPTDMLLAAAYLPLLLLTAYLVFVDAAAAAAIVVFAEIFIPEIRLPQTSVGAGELCLLVAAITSGIRAVRVPTQASHAAPMRLVLCLLGTLAAATLATILHAQFHLPVLRETAKVVEYFLAAAFGVTISARRTPPARLLLIFACIGIAVAAGALIELHTGTASVFRGNGYLVPRIAGGLEGPNQLGAFLALLLPLYVAAVVVYRDRWLCAPLYAAGLLCTLALFLTFSRAGIVCGLFSALLSAGIAARFVTNARPVRFAFLAVTTWTALGALAAYCVAGPAILHLGTIGNEGDTGAVGHRGDLWRAAIFFWRSSPIIGIGAGNFENELNVAGLPHVHTHANSLYLQSLAEGGMILFAATLASIVVPLARMAARLRESPLIAAIFAALLGFALHQFVDTLNFYPKIGILAWLLTGIALGVRTPDPAQPDIDHYAHAPAAVR